MGGRGQGRVEGARVPSSNRENENEIEESPRQRVSLSTPSPQQHPPPQILGYPHPPHVAQHCRDPQSRMIRANAVGLLPLPPLFCEAVVPSTLCVRGVYPLSPSLACFGLGSSLGVVEGIRKRHRRRRCWSGGPLRHESHQSTPRRTIFWRWWRQILLSLGVWFRCRASRRRSAPAWVIVFIVGAGATRSLVLLFALLLFLKPRQARAAPMAARQRERGSRFSRIPQRSCSVGAAMLASHVYDTACLAVRRRVGLGLGRTRIKLLVVV